MLRNLLSRKKCASKRLKTRKDTLISDNSCFTCFLAQVNTGRSTSLRTDGWTRMARSARVQGGCSSHTSSSTMSSTSTLQRWTISRGWWLTQSRWLQTRCRTDLWSMGCTAKNVNYTNSLHSGSGKHRSSSRQWISGSRFCELRMAHTRNSLDQRENKESTPTVRF